MLERELEARRKAGFDVQWLTEEEIKERFDIDKAYGGILSTQGASVDAFCFLHELLQYNQRKGLRIFDKSALGKVTKKGQMNLCTLDTGAVIKAKRIVYCIGYESQTMIKEKFVDLLSTYAMVSEVNPVGASKLKDILIWNTSTPYLYMRTTDDSRILIGGEDEKFKDAVKRDSLLTQKELKLHRAFKKMFATITFIPDFSWAGTFGETKDGLPYIGTHKDFKDAYFVLGFGGNGITFSVVGMEMTSNWLKGKKHPLTDIFAFGR